jgi:hypothetical protein
LREVTNEDFQDFIERFEWSTDQPDAAQLPIDLLDKIIALGLARDEVDAKAVADRLFVHVCRLLGTSGTKRLTIEGRKLLLDQLALPVADRELMAHLRAVVAEHSSRLDRLEADVSEIGTKVETLLLVEGSAQRIQVAVPIPDVTFPQPVARLSPRPNTVADLCRRLDPSGWLAIHGGAGVGKTQLAIQIAATCGTTGGWIRFHHSQVTTDAAILLDAALTEMAGWRDVPRGTRWYPEALSAIGTGSIVALDH